MKLFAVFYERMQVADDLIKFVAVAHGIVPLRGSGIQRYAQFIKAGCDQLILSFFID